MGNLFTTAAVLNVVFLAVPTAMAAVEYSVEPLGNFSPYAMNNQGEVVGVVLVQPEMEKEFQVSVT